MLHQAAAEALAQRQPLCEVSTETKQKARRGPHTALSTGISHGSGQTEPCHLENKGVNGAIVQELNELEPFKRLVGFASCEYFYLVFLHISDFCSKLSWRLMRQNYMRITATISTPYMPVIPC